MNNLNDSPDDSLDLESSRLCYNNPRLESSQNPTSSAVSGTLYHLKTENATETAKKHKNGNIYIVLTTENIIYNNIYRDSESSFLIILNPEYYFYQKWLNFFAVIRNLI